MRSNQKSKNQQEYSGDEDINEHKKQSPKFYRNNNLIHRGIIQKKKIIRNEENPLKSVAQKIRNSNLKQENVIYDKDDNEEYEQVENEEDEDNEQGIEDIQDLEQEEYEDVEEDYQNKNQEIRNKGKEMNIKQQIINVPKKEEKKVNYNNNNVIKINLPKERVSPREKYKYMKQAKENEKVKEKEPDQNSINNNVYSIQNKSYNINQNTKNNENEKSNNIKSIPNKIPIILK